MDAFNFKKPPSVFVPITAPPFQSGNAPASVLDAEDY
jgi:hypothetical protein